VDGLDPTPGPRADIERLKGAEMVAEGHKPVIDYTQWSVANKATII